MEFIPLKILIIDIDEASSKVLKNSLEGNDGVISIDILKPTDTERVYETIKNKGINAIYIDPISADIKHSGNLILSIRKEFQEIVFVLYYDHELYKEFEQGLNKDLRNRFRGYFKLNKLTPGPQFEQSVNRTVDLCQQYLAMSLTKETIERLRTELLELQKKSDVETDSVTVPKKLIEQIQEQLIERKRDAETFSNRKKTAGFLGPSASVEKKNTCFVIMPYSKSWSNAVEQILEEICKDLNIELLIAKTMEGRFIPQDIWKGITGSEIVIADLTDSNANVAYEVGLADAIGKAVFLICQDTNVPFDFSGQRLVVYEDTVAGSIKLRNELTQRIKNFKENKIANE